ncbi:MAG: putative Ig domain-containing protein, partial [Nanopusillaceae archaeon]
LGSTAQRTLTLTVLPGAGVYFEDFENISDWSYDPQGLWHTTNNVKGVDLTGRGMVAYYGKDDTTNPNYDTGGRTWGSLISPPYDVEQYRGQQAIITFDYWRQVEYYPTKPFDITSLWVRWLDASSEESDWTKVWSCDSTVPSESRWITVSVEAGVVPADASYIQVRFSFDSVDGYANNFVGWLVDNLMISFAATPLRIVTTALPEGEVGLDYYFQLEAQGGTASYTWSLAERSELPPGLVLTATGVIRGTPRDIWRGTVCVKVTDGAGNIDTKCFTLVINPRITLFFEDFENISDWSYDPQGLWHTTNNVKGVDLTGRGMVAYYGKDDTTNPNYDTGGRTWGALVSPEIDLIGSRYVQISFKHWRWVESYHAAFDQTYIQVSFKISGMTEWTDWVTPAGAYKDARYLSEKQWTDWVIGPFEVPTGAEKMKIKFVFDSVDKFFNNYVGWLIDDVRVSIAQSGAPLSLLTLPKAMPRDTKITVFNIPNPVRDVHTTTFVVRGVEADLIRVEVYDLTGRLVYAGEAPGNELVWHTQDLLGRYLANGVYLYKVLVKVGDTWIVSDVQKIVILR